MSLSIPYPNLWTPPRLPDWMRLPAMFFNEGKWQIGSNGKLKAKYVDEVKVRAHGADNNKCCCCLSCSQLCNSNTTPCKFRLTFSGLSMCSCATYLSGSHATITGPSSSEVVAVRNLIAPCQWLGRDNSLYTLRTYGVADPTCAGSPTQTINFGQAQVNVPAGSADRTIQLSQNPSFNSLFIAELPWPRDCTEPITLDNECTSCGSTVRGVVCLASGGTVLVERAFDDEEDDGI